MEEPRRIIEKLRLSEHPEGGWYRETWRAEAAQGRRAAASAILFLLDDGGRSNWHRVDATELWLWHAGAPLTLSTAATEGEAAADALLGPDVFAGQSPQMVVPAFHWQTALAHAGWSLVSCVVSPGFDFAGFTLADAGWTPGG